MQWKLYKKLREEASLNAQAPEMVKKMETTPASANVIRTNLQPQVDAQELESKPGLENDMIGAIDSQIERLSSDLPEDRSDTPRLNQFKVLWKQFQDQWNKVKTADAMSQQPQMTGNQSYVDQMQKNPNATLQANQPQLGAGPGTFGNY